MNFWIEALNPRSMDVGSEKGPAIRALTLVLGLWLVLQLEAF